MGEKTGIAWCDSTFNPWIGCQKVSPGCDHGESGKGHRDMPATWANDIGWDCKAAGIAFFMKQMAGKKPIPPSLMVREFPEVRHV